MLLYSNCMEDTRTDEEWLLDLFEFEACEECGGFEQNHTVVITPTGQRFALCKENEEIRRLEEAVYDGTLDGEPFDGDPAELF